MHPLTSRVHIAGCLLAITLCLNPVASIAAEPADSSYSLSNNGADARSFGKWYSRFCSALAKNDKREVARFIDSPLRVHIGGDYDSYTAETSPDQSNRYTKESLLPAYDKVFPKRLRQRLITAWKNEFWDRDQGIALANGLVWFDVRSGKNGPIYKLKTINDVPPDIDGILAELKAAEKIGDNKKISSLYSKLAAAYDDEWRCYASCRTDHSRKAAEEKSIRAYQKAISLRTGALEKSPEQARDMCLLADFLIDKPDKNGTAEELYLKSLALQRSLLPPQSPSIAETVKKLETYYKDMPAKKLALRKGDLNRKELALTTKEQQLKSKPSTKLLSDLVSDYIQAGDTYIDLSRKADALKSYKRAYELWKGLKSPDGTLASDLMAPLVALEMPDDAERISSNIKDPYWQTDARKNLIFALARHGKQERANALLEQELEERDRCLPDSTKVKYIEVLIIENRLDEALERTKDWQKHSESFLEADLYDFEARIEKALGNLEAAEKAYQHLVEILKPDRGSKDPTPFKNELATIYLKEKKYAEAQKLADAVITELSKTGKKTTLLGNAFAIKARALAATSPAQADQFYKEAISIKTSAQGEDDLSVKQLKEEFASFAARSWKSQARSHSHRSWSIRVS